MSEAGFPLEPMVLRGAASRWPAMQRWTWERMARLGEGGSTTGSETETGSGSAMGSASASPPASVSAPAELVLYTSDGDPGGRATVADYVAAITAPTASRYGLLYASGWRFFERHPEMMGDFDEPEAAGADALQRLPVRVFNPLLWLFLGGDGSGTALHRDVLDTHAWLAVLAGRKLFALHPPADWDAIFDARQRESVAILAERRGRGDWRYLELAPGDLILIPSRWWHAVVNDGPTLGLTRNFASPDILDRVVAATRAQRLTKLLPWLLPHPPCPPISTSAT